MAELSGEALPNFYNSEANERFLSLPEEELTNLSTNQNQDTSKGSKTWLNVSTGERCSVEKA